MTVPTKTLSGNETIPLIGAGTWDIEGEAVKESVHAAIEAGYTHIDTAEGYMNESEIGDAIAEYDRDELFLTSKVLPSNLDYESVINSCNESLERLGTDYLDLYLIHWPNPAISLRETLNGMEHLHEQGKIRNIGVSNFSSYQLSAAHHIADLPIAVNQIEFHPWFQRQDLIDYCRETNTVIEAAAPLSRTEIFNDESVQELATKYNKSPAQIVLRWATEKDIVVLPKSTSPNHIRENIAVFDWDMDEADHLRLNERAHDQPCYDTGPRDWSRDVYGISE